MATPQDQNGEMSKRQLIDHLKKIEESMVRELELIGKSHQIRHQTNPSIYELKKKILLKRKNIQGLKTKIEYVKSENAERKKSIQEFKRFVTEREESIKNVVILTEAEKNNRTKQETLADRK